MIKELDDAYLDAAKENRQFSGLVNFCNFNPDAFLRKLQYSQLNSS